MRISSSSHGSSYFIWNWKKGLTKVWTPTGNSLEGRFGGVGLGSRFSDDDGVITSGGTTSITSNNGVVHSTTSILGPDGKVTTTRHGSTGLGSRFSDDDDAGISGGTSSFTTNNNGVFHSTTSVLGPDGKVHTRHHSGEFTRASRSFPWLKVFQLIFAGKTGWNTKRTHWTSFKTFYFFTVNAILYILCLEEVFSCKSWVFNWCGMENIVRQDEVGKRVESSRFRWPKQNSFQTFKALQLINYATFQISLFFPFSLGV